MFDPQHAFVDPLLAWYESNGRHDLSWREPDRTPFEISRRSCYSGRPLTR